MNRYPHRLYKQVARECTTNDFGQEVPGEVEMEFFGMCDHQVNGRGRMVAGDGGVSFLFSSTVFLPEGAEIIPNGTVVEIREQDETIRERGMVNRPSGMDYKGSRLWLE